MEAMTYAKIIEPDNPHIDQYLKNYNPDHIVSTLEDELNANTYVRFNEESLINILKEKGAPFETELQRFVSIYDLF